MKAKTMLTAGLMVVSLTASSAGADSTPPTVVPESMSPSSVYGGIPNCTTEERMKELAEENSFAQNNIREAKDMGANVLGAALSIFAGVDIPVGEARDAYNHARSAKQTYEVFTPCTPEQEAEIKKIKGQAEQALEEEVKNSSITPPPQPEESTAEKTGKFLRTLPF